MPLGITGDGTERFAHAFRKYDSFCHDPTLLHFDLTFHRPSGTAQVRHVLWRRLPRPEKMLTLSGTLDGAAEGLELRSQKEIPP